jgi:hypothetical protein
MSAQLAKTLAGPVGDTLIQDSVITQKGPAKMSHKLLSTDRLVSTPTLELQPALFPPEFIGILSETAIQTLAEYLRKNSAPEDVISLVLSLNSLTAYEMTARHNDNQVSYYENDLIADLLPHIINDIVAIGGVFQSQFSNSIPRNVPMMK